MSCGHWDKTLRLMVPTLKANSHTPGKNISSDIFCKTLLGYSSMVPHQQTPERSGPGGRLSSKGCSLIVRNCQLTSVSKCQSRLISAEPPSNLKHLLTKRGLQDGEGGRGVEEGEIRNNCSTCLFSQCQRRRCIIQSGSMDKKVVWCFRGIRLSYTVKTHSLLTKTNENDYNL